MTPSPRPVHLTVDRIVEVARAIVERDGLASLSMRKLGGELGVDPMAVYHHVANKRELLGLLLARALGDLPTLDPATDWDTRIVDWATRYWDLVVANRDLTLACLADPVAGAVGLGPTAGLIAAVADSGLAPPLVDAMAFAIVDMIHGSALAAGAPGRDGDIDELRGVFLIGLAAIVSGMSTRVAGSPPRGHR